MEGLGEYVAGKVAKLVIIVAVIAIIFGAAVGAAVTLWVQHDPQAQHPRPISHQLQQDACSLRKARKESCKEKSSGKEKAKGEAEGSSVMSDEIANTKVAQELDAAVAAYQRQFGRERTIEKLAHMLASRQAAQRLSDEAKERMGFAKRAAE